MSDELLSFVRDVQAPRLKLLEDFCQAIAACGYKPEECLHETQQEVGGDVIRDVIKVRGVPVFEVTTTRRTEGDGLRWTYTYTPRLIEWPLGHPLPTNPGTPKPVG